MRLCISFLFCGFEEKYSNSVMLQTALIKPNIYFSSALPSPPHAKKSKQSYFCYHRDLENLVYEEYRHIVQFYYLKNAT